MNFINDNLIIMKIKERKFDGICGLLFGKVG